MAGELNKTIVFNIAPEYFIMTMLLLTSYATIGGAGPYAKSYSARPIHGRIVDGVTGEPVAGVAALVSWKMEYLSLSTALFVVGHVSTKRKLLVVKEAITDQSGNYRISGWGPVDAGGTFIVLGSDPFVFINKRKVSKKYFGT